MWRRNERGRKGPPASRLPACPRPHPPLHCHPLARLRAHLLGWSTWWMRGVSTWLLDVVDRRGVDAAVFDVAALFAWLCSLGPHPQPRGGTWPRRCGGYAGCRRGRVEVVDTRVVNVAALMGWVRRVSRWSSSTWPRRIRGCRCGMWWLRGALRWPCRGGHVDVVVSRGVEVAVSRWPSRCGGYAGWRGGRVDVVDTRGVDVAMSTWSLSMWWGWGVNALA